MATYDDENRKDQQGDGVFDTNRQFHDHPGIINQDAERYEAQRGGLATKERVDKDNIDYASQLKGLEEGLRGSSFDNASKNFDKKLADAETAAAAGGASLYTGAGGAKDEGKIKGLVQQGINGIKGLSWRKRGVAMLAASGAIATIAVSWLSILNLLNVFQIDNLFRNIEAKSFIRFQVDMDGRTNKWIAAYVKVRLGEIEDKELLPQDQDNFFFRAEGENQFDDLNPFYVWYGIMRKAVGKPGALAKFEQDLLDKEGIRFTSFAYKDGNKVSFRPAVVTINGDTNFTFELTEAEKTALREGRTSELNGRISTAIEAEMFNSDEGWRGNSADAKARRAIKEAVKRHTKPWEFTKRYYLRKSIQNATGVRDWRFFEKTRDKISERKIDIQNRIITKMFPESTKAGKFIQCMFGITTCKTTTDPNDPANRSALASLPDCTDTVNCGGQGVDENGNPINREMNGSTGDALAGEVSGTDGAEDSLIKKITSQLVKKLNVASGIIDMIETIKNVHNNLKSGALSKQIYNANAALYIGTFQVYGTIADQARTGELTAEEMNHTVDILAENGGYSEGWDTVVETSNNVSAVSAAAATISDNPGRKEYCSSQYRAAMALPQNEAAVKKAYGFVCNDEKLNAANNAKAIEEAWNATIGIFLNPVIAAYEATGISTLVGWIGGAIDAVVSATIQPLIEGILSAVGLKDTIDNLVAWAVSKVATMLGAIPKLPEGAPPQMYVNQAVMGGAAAAEAMMRYAGGARTETLNAADQQQIKTTVATYVKDKNDNMSVNEKYFSLNNPQSIASITLFNVVNQPFSTTIASAFNSILDMPATILSGRAHAAAQTGYEAADFAGAYKYDLPRVCIDTPPDKMNLSIATNADDLGLLEKEDLTNEVVMTETTFSTKLYENAGDDVDKLTLVDSVYNCYFLEGITGGSLGASTHDETLGPNAYGAGQDTAAAPVAVGANLPKGTAQELAKKILAHPNIKFQLDYQRAAMEYIAETGRGRACGGSTIDPDLLGIMLMAADRYKMVYGVIIDGHSCNNGFHPRGMAVDINGITKLDGSAKTDDGMHVRWGSNEQALLKEFYDTMGGIMSSELGGGGFGQINCFRGNTKPVRAAGVSYFDDTCHHVHMDIGKRK